MGNFYANLSQRSGIALDNFGTEPGQYAVFAAYGATAEERVNGAVGFINADTFQAFRDQAENMSAAQLVRIPQPAEEEA